MADIVEQPPVVEEKRSDAPRPEMKDLSADDFAAVREGRKKLDEVEAAPEETDGPEITPGTSEPEQTPEQKAAAAEDAAASEAARVLAERKKKPKAPRVESIQAEFDTLTRKKGDAARELEAIEARLAAAQKAEAERTQPPKPAPKPEETAEAKEARLEAETVAAIGAAPTWEQFDADGKTYDEFLKADRIYARKLGAYAAEQRFNELQAAERQRIDDAQAARAEQDHKVAMDARKADFKKRHADVDLDALLNTPIPGLDPEGPGYGPIATFIQNDALGIDAIAYFVKHQDEVKTVCAMHPILAFMEMGAIRERLKGAAHSGPAPEAEELPQEDERLDQPIKPVRGSGSSTPKKSAAELSTDEYIASRNAAERANR